MEIYCLCEGNDLGNKVIDYNSITFKVQTNQPMKIQKTGATRVDINYTHELPSVDVYWCPNCGKKTVIVK